MNVGEIFHGQELRIYEMARGNIANANDLGTGVSAWYFGLPPFSRTYITAVIAFTLASFTLGIVPLPILALLWNRVVRKFEVQSRSSDVEATLSEATSNRLDFGCIDMEVNNEFIHRCQAILQTPNLHHVVSGMLSPATGY